MEDIKEKLFQFYEAGQMELMWMLLKSSGINRFNFMRELYHKYKDDQNDLYLGIVDETGEKYYLMRYDGSYTENKLKYRITSIISYVDDSSNTNNLNSAIKQLIKFLDERIR